MQEASSKKIEHKICAIVDEYEALNKKTPTESISDLSNHEITRLMKDKEIWMEDLELKNVLVCNPESRNIHNKIFGGWLMRQAVELGRYSLWNDIDYNK